MTHLSADPSRAKLRAGALLRRPVPALLQHLLLFLLYFSLIAAIQAPRAGEGMYGDDGAYAARNALEFSRHPLSPYAGLAPVEAVDTGHPLFHVWLVGVQWAMFGPHIFLIYLNLWAWGAWALLMTHLLARDLGRLAFAGRTPRWVGPATALALMSLPWFISHTQQFLDAIPQLALFVTMIWLWMSRRRGWLTVVLCLLPLVRLTGAFIVLGLGVYDLAHGWLARRRRGWWWLARTLAPYAAAAFCLGIYLAIKLLVLKLPLSTIPANSAQWVTSPIPGIETVGGMLATNVHYTWQYFLGPMPYSISPLFLSVGAALALLGSRALARGRRPPRPGRLIGSGYGAVVGAALAALVCDTGFYLVNGHFLLARRFLPHQLVLLVLAVHALVFMFGRWNRLGLVLLLAWSGLQGVRWHEAWVERLVANPARSKYLVGHFIEHNQDLAERKALLHELADWIVAGSPRVCYLGGHLGTSMIRFSANGYLPFDLNWLPVNWLLQQWNVGQALAHHQSMDYSTALILASFEVDSDREAMRTILAAHPEFKLEKIFSNAIGDTVEVWFVPPPSP